MESQLTRWWSTTTCKPITLFVQCIYYVSKTLQDLPIRIVKAAMQAAGANGSEKHVEDISLCGLFLLEAAKRADKAFQVPPGSTQHTIRDASNDVTAMVTNLLSTGAVEERDRTGPPFQEPFARGMEEKASKGWIESLLTSGQVDDDDIEHDLQDGQVSIDYELFHTI